MIIIKIVPEIKCLVLLAGKQIKYTDGMTNNVGSDWTDPSGERSHLVLHCLHYPICPNA